MIPQLDREKAKECVNCGHVAFLEAEQSARQLIESLKTCASEIENGTAAGMIQDQNEAPAMVCEAHELVGKAQGLLKEIHRYHKAGVEVVRANGLEVPVVLGGGGR